MRGEYTYNPQSLLHVITFRSFLESVLYYTFVLPRSYILYHSIH